MTERQRWNKLSYGDLEEKLAQIQEITDQILLFDIIRSGLGGEYEVVMESAIERLTDQKLLQKLLLYPNLPWQYGERMMLKIEDKNFLVEVFKNRSSVGQAFMVSGNVNDEALLLKFIDVAKDEQVADIIMDKLQEIQ